jgi:two-component system chemotaxis response regulator CheY
MARGLIVDDAPSVCHFLAMCVSDLPDLEVIKAHDGVEALRRIGQGEYDLVFLDINLPLLDGFKVLAGLRESDERRGRITPVIVLTISNDPATRGRAHSMKAYYMSKPAQAYEIRDAVRQFISVPAELHGVHELRQAPRLRVRVRVRFGHENERWLESHDISPLGMFVKSDTWHPVGTRGAVTIEFPHLDESLEVECTVVHVRKHTIGTSEPRVRATLSQAFVTPASHESADTTQPADSPEPS